MSQPRGRRLAAACTVLSVFVLGALGAAGATAHAATAPRWLCLPGHAPNPCAVPLTTTRITPTGAVMGPVPVARTRPPKVDCFYVYPTVSDQPAPAASLHVDPEERSIALYQAARYASVCRVYAPMYHQITLRGILAPTTVAPALRDRAYLDVRDAWRTYLRRYNGGRGIVLLSHSQGTFVLRRLVAEEIDPKPAERRRLVSALLLGGDVLVRKGQDRGGDFQHVAACRSATQLGCVVAFSTYNETPPADSLFGRPAVRYGVGPRNVAGLEVLCTNPAALAGGAAKLDSIFPSRPFAPGTAIGAVTTQVGLPQPAVSTSFIEARGAYVGRCSRAGGANVLRIAGEGGAPVLHPLADARWGLHLTDANIALGDLVALVRRQADRYAAGR